MSQRGPVELYTPRRLVDLDPLTSGEMILKAYGLLAEGRSITPDMLVQAQDLLDGPVAQRAAATGDSNGLGFVIIHPGETGLTISLNWWAQGSVLCQHLHRQTHGQPTCDPLSRPVIGCVWELAVIEAEQRAWRETMMRPDPDPEIYLTQRLATAIV